MLSEGADALRSEMESHYQQARDGPHPPTSVEHLDSAALPGNKGVVHIFHVTFGDLPQGMPVSVVQTDDGWKVDWRAFVEFREGRLRKFFSRYQDAPATLRVRLRRVEHQDRAVPDPDQKYAFHLSVPIDGHEGFAFVGKDDPTVGPKIGDKLDPNASPSHVMASLRWVRGISGRGYVELCDIVSDTWRPRP